MTNFAYHTDIRVQGAIIARQNRERELIERARLRPLPERVAEKMRDIAAVRGSCDMDDLSLCFPGEKLTDQVIASAKRIAGRRETVRVG